MSLEPGTMLGHYEIRSLIGVGGMGEVYRAHDHKLARDVALKVLPEAFARDPERIARFRREARLLAALNHTNIASIYGFEEDKGKHFLVMELVEGDTLREQIIRDGAASAEEVVGIGKQIAEALEHAHEKNIIHRDLKPANVKVTPAGVVKVLDFGLAKAFAAEPESGDPTDTPTLMSSPTLPGVILGTAAYMSPEQAKGKRVDKRTDIWALGCVLYELLTAQGAFTRHPSRDRKGAEVHSAGSPPLAGARGSDAKNAEPDTVQEIIARILQAEPDWSALPESTPPGIRALLRRCLTKDLNRRLRGAADISIALEDALHAAAASAPIPAPLPAPPLWSRAVWLALVLLLTATVVSVATWYLRPAAPSGLTAVVRLTVALSPGDQLANVSGVPSLALSPDGSQLVYAGSRGGKNQLYIRALDSLETKPLPGTEDAQAPFFSPDGQWIGFFAQAKLKKVSITGGSLQTLCEAPNAPGGSWAPDDTIFFAPSNNSGIWKVPASGGKPEEVTKPDHSKGEYSHRWPQVLPGGKAILFTAMVGLAADDSQTVAHVLATGERRVLVQGGMMGRYSPPGNLVYFHGGSLLASPFDPVRLEVTGSVPVTVAEGIVTTTVSIGAQYASSSAESLAYIPAALHQYDRRPVWVSRTGDVQPIPVPSDAYRGPVLSPDGKQAALFTDSISSDVRILDVARGAVTRLTSEAGGSGNPVWTPDGKRIIYRAVRGGFRNLFWRAADGTGGEERLVPSEASLIPDSVSPDGKFLAFESQNPATGFDLVVLPLKDGGKPQVFLRTPFNEQSAAFSPDGRWLAYNSNQSGRFQIYVQPFPGPGGKWQISTEGGQGPHWARNGRELFYLNGDRMMAVQITTSPAFSAGKPVELFEGRYYQGGPSYDVTPDGQRFLMIQTVEPEQPATQINVILNWQKAAFSR